MLSRVSRRGRCPHPGAWEVFQLWKHHDENTAQLIENFPHLSPTQINAALAYAAAHLDEMPLGEFGTKPAFAREFKVE
jgi:hypothetical protein